MCGKLGLEGKVSFDAMSPAVIVDKRLYEIFREVGAELLVVVEVDVVRWGTLMN